MIEAFPLLFRLFEEWPIYCLHNEPSHQRSGENWLTRFVKRHEDLMSSYLRKYDYQRARCEDPKQIQAWFNLVQNTVAKYGIATEDIYNFDESGFQMGVIATTKVVTQMGRSKKSGARIKPGRPKVVQPGDRNWVTVIEGINATGWALPSTIIFEGKVHQSPCIELTSLQIGLLA